MINNVFMFSNDNKEMNNLKVNRVVLKISDK